MAAGRGLIGPGAVTRGGETVPGRCLPLQLRVDMIVMPGSPATLKPQLRVLQAKLPGKGRFQKHLAHHLIGKQRTRQGCRAFRFQRTVRPKPLPCDPRRPIRNAPRAFRPVPTCSAGRVP